MRLTRTSPCLLLLALLALPAMAQDGQLLRKQRFAANAHVGNVQLSGAQFEFACHPAKDGALSVSLVLPKSADAAGFALDRFEGPDGIGEERDLALWSVDTRGAGMQVKGPIGGWYGVDGDGFIFSRSQANRKPDAMGKLVAALLVADALRLRLSVAAPESGEALQAELLLQDYKAAIREVVAPCL